MSHDVPMQNLFRMTFEVTMVIIKNYKITGAIFTVSSFPDIVLSGKTLIRFPDTLRNFRTFRTNSGRLVTLDNHEEKIKYILKQIKI